MPGPERPPRRECTRGERNSGEHGGHQLARPPAWRIYPLQSSGNYLITLEEVAPRDYQCDCGQQPPHVRSGVTVDGGSALNPANCANQHVERHDTSECEKNK